MSDGCSTVGCFFATCSLEVATPDTGLAVDMEKNITQVCFKQTNAPELQLLISEGQTCDLLYHKEIF